MGQGGRFVSLYFENKINLKMVTSALTWRLRELVDDEVQRLVWSLHQKLLEEAEEEL